MRLITASLIFACAISFLYSCKKESSNDSWPFTNFSDSLAGTWTWAHYTGGYTPQGTPTLKLNDTSITITKIAADTLRLYGYNFQYTDTLRTNGGYTKQAIDLSKYRCFQAYYGEHTYLYLMYNLQNDSVHVHQYSGGVQYGGWSDYYTQVHR